MDWHHNLRIASLSIYNTYEERLTYDGSVRTICGSVDGRYFAYTDTSNDNNLHVLDLVDSSKNKTYALYMPSIDGGDTTSLLEYADVMDFDISNAHVIFDALSNFQLGSTAYEFWSVGILDIGTGNVSNLISAQPSGVDIGNPSASSTQDWIIAVDVIDNNTGMCETRVVNLQTGKSGLVGEQLFVEQPGAESLNDGLGWPTFNGDGTYVALQYKQPGEVEASVIKVPISADSDGTVAGDFSHAESIEYNAYRPRYYRSGQSGGQAHIVVSSNTLDFGSVLVGSSAQRLVTVGNTGSYPLMITGYALSDSVQFMHDGGPIEIPPGYQMDVSVVFTPAGEGAQSAVLTIQSDDPEVPEVQVNLAGQAYTDGSAGGGGNTRRGCFIATAAYGSYLEPHVMVLRQLRDEHLLTNGPGRAFVAAYYRCSPPIASFIAKHESLRTATRGVLTPVVLVVQYPEPALAIFLAVAGGGLVWRNRRSACRKSRG